MSFVNENICRVGRRLKLVCTLFSLEKFGLKVWKILATVERVKKDGRKEMWNKTQIYEPPGK